MNNELFIIIVIILVLWFINNNTTHKKSNKPVKKDFFLNVSNQPHHPPNAKECMLQSCTINGQLCTSDTPGALGHNWICHDKKWVSLPPHQPQSPHHPPNAKECMLQSCTINGQLCTSDTPGAGGYNWICHDKKWVSLPPHQPQPPQPPHQLQPHQPPQPPQQLQPHQPAVPMV